MKNTVFTVIAVLLMATLCLPAAAQTWTLDTWYDGPDDDDVAYGNDIHDIEFRDNHQVFFGKYDRLYKWDLNLGRLWWWDFHGDDVSHVEVPRGDSSVVIHTTDHRGRIYIRNADDLSEEVNYQVPFDEWMNFLSLDVDRGGYYIILQYEHGMLGGIGNAGVSSGTHKYEGRLYDIWDGGWTVSYTAGDTYDEPDGDLVLHPTWASEEWNDGKTRWYRQVDVDAERFYAYRNHHGWNSHIGEFITTSWDHIDKIAVAPDGNSKAALDSGNVIHVWSNVHYLFAFNSSEGYSAHDNILEFTNNGELLVTAYGRWIRFWDMSQQAEDHSFWVDAMDDDESIESLAFSDDGKKMALGSSNGTAYIYRWTGGSAPAAPAQEVEPAQPTALLSNYPNPFNPETWIPYQLSEAAEVTVTIHSSDGKLVRELELGQVPAGVYSDKDRAAYWDGQNEQGEPVASGVYFYTLQAGDFKATRKMVIRK